MGRGDDTACVCDFGYYPNGLSVVLCDPLIVWCWCGLSLCGYR